MTTDEIVERAKEYAGAMAIVAGAIALAWKRLLPMLVWLRDAMTGALSRRRAMQAVENADLQDRLVLQNEINHLRATIASLETRLADTEAEKDVLETQLAHERHERIKDFQEDRSVLKEIRNRVLRGESQIREAKSSRPPPMLSASGPKKERDKTPS